MASENVLKDSKSGFRPALWGQFFGFFMDSYDMALVVVMSPILAKIFLSPKGDPVWHYITIILGYSITLVARPIGAAIFGHFGDKIGRKNLWVVTIGLVGVFCGLSGLLPTYADIGIYSWVLFAILRLLMGIAFGGEFGLGNTLVLEFAPKKHRGLIGGIAQSGFPLGFVVSSFVFAGMNNLLGSAAMLEYGWRIVFFTGLAPVFLSIIIRKKAQESPLFHKAKEAGTIEKYPFLNLFKPPALWSFLQVFFFMVGVYMIAHSAYTFLPQVLTLNGAGFDATTYAMIYGSALFVTVIGYILYGWLSDIYGRRKTQLIHMVYIVLAGIPLYYILYNAVLEKNILIAVIATSLLTWCKAFQGITPSYLSERFPTKRRAVGMGFGYNSGTLIAAWFSLYIYWIHEIPFVTALEGQHLWFSPAILLVLGAIIVFISTWVGPETKDLELEDVK